MRDEDCQMPEKRICYLDLETGQTRPVRDARPLVSSAAAGWNGVLLEEAAGEAIELNGICGISHIAVVQLDSPIPVELRADGVRVSKKIGPGQVTVVPANLPHSVRARPGGGYIAVALEPKFLLGTAAELGNADGVQLRCVVGTDDPIVRELILGLREEARNPSLRGSLYAESLATAIAAHLVHRYSSGAKPVRALPGGLTKRQLRRVIEFVHDRLDEDISLAQLAGETGLSPFHFARLFKKSTGCTPHAYVTRCRVERARQLLLQSPASITHVALEVGFCDQSHLSRHFRRLLGLTPGDFVRTVVRRRKSP